jgi:Fe-S-cluster containining protein
MSKPSPKKRERRERRKQKRGRHEQGGATRRDAGPVFAVNVEAVAEGERSAAVEIISEGRTPEKLRELALNAVWWGDHVLAGLHAKQPPSRPLACGNGCSWCCHLHVDAKAPEIFLIADYVKDILAPAPEEIDALKQRLTTVAARTEGLDPGRRALAKIPCALLVDGRCSVYKVRPLACRVGPRSTRRTAVTRWSARTRTFGRTARRSTRTSAYVAGSKPGSTRPASTARH